MSKISVLMSAYNADPYIAKAIQSVLRQTHTDFELLIMDDGSNDNTVKEIEQFHDSRIKLLKQSNQGKSVAVNELFKHATGEYIVIHDADDECHPDRLKILANALDHDPNLTMVFSGYALIIDNKLCAPRRSELDKQQCKDLIFKRIMPGLDPTLMVRASIAKQFPFNPELKIGQGYDFILRVGEQFESIVLPDVLYHYRFHYASITKAKVERKVEFLLKVINGARIRASERPLTHEEFYEQIKGYLEDKSNNLAGHFTDSAYWSVKSGRRWEAVNTALTSLKYCLPFKLEYIKPLIYALLPHAINRKLRNSP